MTAEDPTAAPRLIDVPTPRRQSCCSPMGLGNRWTALSWPSSPADWRSGAGRWCASSFRAWPGTAALGLWGLCSLYFGSSVVLLKFRREPATGFSVVLVSGSLATALVCGGWCLGLLQPLETLAYGVALIKGAWLLSRLVRYRSAPIGRVAAIESAAALLFLLLAAVALLPATLQP